VRNPLRNPVVWIRWLVLIAAVVLAWMFVTRVLLP